MCLIVFAYNKHPQYRLILAANRDEFYARPTAPAGFWEDCPAVLAGRDLEHMGTWLGVTQKGRFAALTNYRNPAATKNDARSRGELASKYLCGAQTPGEYMNRVNMQKDSYNGFNLLIGDSATMMYYSNVSDRISELTPGIYGLSNHLLDTPWPKVERAKHRFTQLINTQEPVEDDLLSLLADDWHPPDAQLPDTGVPLEWERRLSPIFITSNEYGTRASSLLFLDYQGKVRFIEKNATNNSVSKLEFTVNID